MIFYATFLPVFQKSKLLYNYDDFVANVSNGTDCFKYVCTISSTFYQKYVKACPLLQTRVHVFKHTHKYNLSTTGSIRNLALGTAKYGTLFSLP